MTTYQVAWYIPERIILYEPVGALSNKLAEEVTDHHLLPLIGTGVAPVHILIDYTQVTDINYSLQKALDNPRTADQYATPNLGWIVHVVNENPHFYYLVQSYLAQQYEVKMHQCQSRQHALEFLLLKDETLTEPLKNHL